MKNSPRPLFPLHQTLQLARCIRAGGVLLASTKRRYVRRNARWWSMIHHSIERISIALESNGGELAPLQPTVGIAHSDLRLMCSCSSMETHSMKLSTNSVCADVASSISLELVVSVTTRQMIFLHYVLQHSVVPFRELVWPTTSRLTCCCSETFPLRNNSTCS